MTRLVLATPSTLMVLVVGVIVTNGEFLFSKIAYQPAVKVGVPEIWKSAKPAVANAPKLLVELIATEATEESSFSQTDQSIKPGNRFERLVQPEGHPTSDPIMATATSLT